MRTARPKKLYSGWWGAYVAGGDVEPDMLMCICTRSGQSWFSKVRRVLWRGSWGAICERIDIAAKDDLNLEIPFLDHFRPANELDKLVLGQCRNLVYDWVEDVNGPPPEIEQYEYYQDFEWDRDFYESRAQGTIEELSREVASWLWAKSNQRAESTLSGQASIVGDEDIQTNFREEHIRRQKERIPRQIANLSDYSRLGGPDSAWN